MPAVTRLATAAAAAAPRHCGAPLLEPLQGAGVCGGVHLPHTHTAVRGAAEHQGTLGLWRTRRENQGERRERKGGKSCYSDSVTLIHCKSPLDSSREVTLLIEWGNPQPPN